MAHWLFCAYTLAILSAPAAPIDRQQHQDQRENLAIVYILATPVANLTTTISF